MNRSEVEDLRKRIAHHLFTRASKNQRNFGSESVSIQSQYDGSYMFWENALTLKCKDYWFIFTEHYNDIVFHEDDVLVRVYNRVWEDNSSILEDFIKQYEQQQNNQSGGNDNG